jgi:hypothetical protein
MNRPRVKHAKTIKNAPHDDNDSDFIEDSESEEKLEAAKKYGNLPPQHLSKSRTKLYKIQKESRKRREEITQQKAGVTNSLFPGAGFANLKLA